MGFGLGTLQFQVHQKMFSKISFMQGLRDHMKQNANTRKKTFVGNIYIPHGNETGQKSKL